MKATVTSNGKKPVAAATKTPPVVLPSRFAPVESLIPYARNARTHSPAQVAQIAASIAEFGFTNAILADEKGIVAGHGRVLGAQQLYAAGKTIALPSGEAIPVGTVPVVDCTGWSDTKRRAYILADNQLALNAGYDLELLRLELTDLKLEGFDLDLLGFGDLLTDLLDPAAGNDKDPDEVPDVPAVAESKPGDVWVLGAHRVLCGDSTSVLDWGNLMKGETADACWTDPPYNVAYESKLAGKIQNDSMGDGKFLAFLTDAFTALFTVLKPGGAIYVAHADTEGYNFRSAFRAAGFKLSGCLVWKKDSLVLGRSDFQWMHEPILYGWKPGSRHRWYGGRKLTTVQDWGGDPVVKREDGSYQIVVGDRILTVSGDAKIEESPSSVFFHEKPKRSSEHPTMKPVGLVERMLKCSARSGDVVIDAFGGSGSTLVAADRLGMSARLMELDPKFVDVIVKRWQNYTGRRAVHGVTGVEFPAEKEAPNGPT